MTQIYTILFDLDGTIVNTAPDLMAAHNHVMKKFGHQEKKLSDIKSLAGKGAWVMMQRSFKKEIQDEKLKQNMTKEFIDYYSKNIERISRFFRSLIPMSFRSNHKFQNKNQITTTDTILYLLKKKNYNPNFVIDVRCGYGEWTKKSLKYFKSSNYLLFDGDDKNEDKLKHLSSKYKNIKYMICILSNKIKTIKFYKNGYGSSVYEETNNFSHDITFSETTTLCDQLPLSDLYNKNNLIKLDVQGSEIDILNGLKKKINLFDVIILEVSVVEYNKNAPLLNETVNFLEMNGWELVTKKPFCNNGPDGDYCFKKRNKIGIFNSFPFHYEMFGFILNCFTFPFIMY